MMPAGSKASLSAEIQIFAGWIIIPAAGIRAVLALGVFSAHRDCPRVGGSSLYDSDNPRVAEAGSRESSRVSVLQPDCNDGW
jgi:hypothetical protein